MAFFKKDTVANLVRRLIVSTVLAAAVVYALFGAETTMIHMIKAIVIFVLPTMLAEQAYSALKKKSCKEASG